MRSDPTLDDAYWINMRIGLCYKAACQYPKAIQAFRTCLERSQETGERVKTAWSLVNTGDTLLLQRKVSEAEDYIEQAGALFQKIGTRFGVLSSNLSMSRVALELGDPQRARKHAEIACQIAREIHSPSWISKTDALLRQIDAELSRLPNPKINQEQEKFSERELEVLQLLKSELSGPEIARRLYISLNTVRYHTKNIYQKLGVNTRLEAIQRARDLGL
jgi:ATP/maltotriose-dependent transcriptional regulator MalT